MIIRTKKEYTYVWTSSKTGEPIMITRICKSNNFYELVKAIERITYFKPEPRWINNRKWLLDDRTGERSDTYILRIGCSACFLHPDQVPLPKKD